MYKHGNRRFPMPLVLLLLLAVFGLTTFRSITDAAQALQGPAAGERCKTFLETGKTVCDSFYAFWRQKGGLPIFGYPISNSFQATSELDGKEYLVQYFERAVFELHPENKPPYDVLLAQLGTLKFNSTYPKGEPKVPYTDELPLYPGAMNVKTDRPQNTSTKILTTFTTKDDAAKVTAFYKDVYSKNTQWHLTADRPTLLEFSTAQGEYRMSVLVTASAGITSVSLVLDYFPPM